MKKLIALVLTVVVSLSLTACGMEGLSLPGGSEEKKSVVGTWEYAGSGLTLVLHEDYTGKLTERGSERNIVWMYDEGARLLLCTMAGSDFVEDMTYMEDYDMLYCDGMLLIRATG